MTGLVGRVVQALVHHFGWRSTLAVGSAMFAIQIGFTLLVERVRTLCPEAVRGGLLVMVDFRPLIGAEEAYRVFDLYPPEIMDLVYGMYALDFLLPVAMSLLFVSAYATMLRYLGRWHALVLLPLASVPCDWAENLCALVLLARLPDRSWGGLAAVGGIATALKFLFMVTSMVGVVGLALALLQRRAAHRTA